MRRGGAAQIGASNLSVNPDWETFPWGDLGQVTYPCSHSEPQLLHSKLETRVFFLKGYYVCISPRTLNNGCEVFSVEPLYWRCEKKERKPLCSRVKIKA